MVDSSELGAKPKNRTYPKGQFGTYEAMAKWKGTVKKIMVRRDYARDKTAVEAMETSAFKWIWESKVSAKLPFSEALAALRIGTNPKTADGTYWRTLSRTNFSLVEQLNFYNGQGFDCLRGTGWLEDSKEFRPFRMGSAADANDYMYRNKSHLGEFIKRALEPDHGPMMSLSFTADQLMTKRFRGGLPSADVRKTTLVHDQGEVPVTFDHLALCFVPLDVVPRAHFSRQGVMQSEAPCEVAWNHAYDGGSLRGDSYVHTSGRTGALPKQTLAPHAEHDGRHQEVDRRGL